MSKLKVLHENRRCFDQETGDELLYVKIDPELLKGAEELPTCELGVAFPSKTIGEVLDDMHFPAACVNIKNSYSREERNIQVEDIRFLLNENTYAVTNICDQEAFQSNPVVQELIPEIIKTVEEFLDRQPLIIPEITIPNEGLRKIQHGEEVNVEIESKDGYCTYSVSVYATPDGNIRFDSEEKVTEENGESCLYKDSDIETPEKFSMRLHHVAEDYAVSCGKTVSKKELVEPEL